MANPLAKQRFGRLAVTEKLNEIIEELNPIIDMQGKGGIVITKNEGRWMIKVDFEDIDAESFFEQLGVDTVTEQRCVNGSVVERTYLILDE